ncbi:hypothetical protein EXIGLDRAFT_828830 [Exidia glandulosa HHB12029]|uniref:DUF6533 domain-containing protein n=1 Tax=Exidia glandulosa HHB12029 TaxID=1314781 RepID=A0A165Q4U9_EXIGL|nr:hypothetical protein EXIGLDRAFT_828830 [Exidia glandulosa HHB12029]
MAATSSPFQLPPGILAQLSDAVYFASITRFEHAGAYTLLLYDWLLCLEHELKLISTPGLAPGKLAYLFCRYWPILTHPITIWVQLVTSDRALCEKTFRIPLFLTIVNFSGAASVLIVRVYAFTGARRLVAFFLVFCFAVVAAYQIWTVATQIALVTAPAPFCFPVDREGAAPLLSGYFLAPFLFDVVATATFVWHAFSVRLQLSDMTGAVGLFVREGAAYFIAISAINLVNAVMNFLPDETHHGVMAPMSMLLPSILACRLVINLRSAASEGGLHSGVSGKRDTQAEEGSFGFEHSRWKNHRSRSRVDEETASGPGTRTRTRIDYEMAPFGDVSR